MAFRRNNTPGDRLLRSKSEAPSIAAPQKQLSIAAYEKATKRKVAEPLPIKDSIAYGERFRKQVVPNLDSRRAGLPLECACRALGKPAAMNHDDGRDR